MTDIHEVQLARVGRPADPRVTIVVPAKNEARNLEVVLPQLPPVHEVILVDGHSTDGTVETARATLPGIRVLSQTRRGKGNALAVGFEAATGDIIVMFDADGSADPREIPSFVEALVAGADFAKGSRNMTLGGSEDITGLRDLGNSTLVRLANLLLGTPYTDLCYGYNAFWRDVLGAFDLPPTQAGPVGNAADEMLWGDGFEIETLLNCRAATAGLSIVEVPSVECARIHGESNLNAVTDGLRVVRTLLAERKRRPGVRSRTTGNPGNPQGGRSGEFAATPDPDHRSTLSGRVAAPAIPAPRSAAARVGAATAIATGVAIAGLILWT